MREEGRHPLRRGVVSVVLTPFLDDGALDLESLAATVEDRIAAGVVALLTPVVASEVHRLDDAESRTVLRTVQEQAAGRVPVIAGCPSPDRAESVDFARFATELGCAGVLVRPPVEQLQDGNALRTLLESVARAGVPLIVLQDLDWSGAGIPVTLLCELFETVPAFRALKIEGAPAGPKYSAVLAATGGRLHVSGGWAMTQLIEGLDRGVHAFCPSAHHWVYVEILRRYDAGRRTDAQELFRRLLPVLAFCMQHIDVSIQVQKLLAVRQGIFRSATVRSPRVVLDEHHRRLIDELLELAVALHDECGWRPTA
jgi:dihydrodipicolinate synthase/N-acetylneuraminate lyase